MSIPSHPEMNRTQRQLKLLGILFIVFGALGLLGLPGIGAMHLMVEYVMSQGVLEIPVEEEAMVQALLRTLTLAMILLVAVHVFFNALVGFCLMRYKYYWPCYLSVLFTILSFPLGTAMGVFGLIVMSRPEAKQLFGLSSPTSPSPQPSDYTS